MAPPPTKPEQNTFKHPKLGDATTQVRLLKFLPSGDEELGITLSTYKLDEAPEYNSVSYTWGEPGHDREVIIDGSSFYIRLNCFDALQRVRQNFPGTYVWIDSICINQADLEEKSQQVQLMWQIYTQAQNVLSCVGEHRDDSELLLPFSEELKSVNYPVPLYRNSKTRWVEWLLSVDEERAKRLALAFKCFSERQYWKRLWVVQELAAKSNQEDPSIRILCGNDIIPWDRIRILRGVLVTVAVKLKDRGFFSDLPEALFGTCLERMVAFLGDGYDLGSAIFLFGGFECADPRDRLYALLHLWEGGKHMSRVIPDYSMPIFDVAKLACELSWFASFGNVLARFEIDYRFPEVVALVQQRSSRSEKGPTSSGATVIKLMDWADPVDKEKTYSSYVTLHSADSGALKAPFRENVERWSVQSSNSELKRLYQEMDSTPHLAAEFEGRRPIILHSDEGAFAGILCAESRPGDILVPVFLGLYGVLLVMRQQKGSVYDVVGQGLIWDDFRIPDTPDSQGTCAKIDLRLSTDDVVVIFCQDATNTYDPNDDTALTKGPREGQAWPFYDPESRLKRLITKPIEAPVGAATILEADWPIFPELPDGEVSDEDMVEQPESS